MFNWVEYFDLAQELVKQSENPATGNPATREAKLRSAISRAYYAAFCSTRNYLKSNKQLPVPSGGRAHRIIWEHLCNSGDRKWKKAGVDGFRLRDDRNKADYDDKIKGDLSLLAEVSLKRAKHIISAVGALQ